MPRPCARPIVGRLRSLGAGMATDRFRLACPMALERVEPLRRSPSFGLALGGFPFRCFGLCLFTFDRFAFERLGSSIRLGGFRPPSSCAALDELVGALLQLAPPWRPSAVVRRRARIVGADAALLELLDDHPRHTAAELYPLDVV